MSTIFKKKFLLLVSLCSLHPLIPNPMKYAPKGKKVAIKYFNVKQTEKKQAPSKENKGFIVSLFKKVKEKSSCPAIPLII